MLQTTSSSTTNKLISVDRIEEISNGKMIEQHSSMELATRFLTPEAKLAFAELR